MSETATARPWTRGNTSDDMFMFIDANGRYAGHVTIKQTGGGAVASFDEGRRLACAETILRCVNNDPDDGPWGYLIIDPSLAEDDWRFSLEPSDEAGLISLPLRLSAADAATAREHMRPASEAEPSP